MSVDIPGYKLGREAVSGQVCSVYNALDLEQSKTVIVKVISKALSTNKVFRDHFRSVTGQLLNQTLGHNVRLLDAVMNDDSCLLVTGYCPCSIQSQATRPVYDDVKVLEIAVDLVTSLAMLHRLGIVHGGVELSNIHFLDSGEVVLGTVAMHRTMPGNTLSRFGLDNIQDILPVAPEAENGLTASSDYFSLGVVLYELLTGQKPFNTERLTELNRQKKAGNYGPLSESQAYLKPLFDGLLSSDPKLRIDSEELFFSVLETCQGKPAAINKPVEVNPVNTQSKPVRTQQSDESAAWAGKKLLLPVIAIAVIGAGLSVWFASGKKNSVQEAEIDVVNRLPTTEAGDATTESTAETKEETNGFYTNALSLAQTGDFEAALQAIDHAQKLEPGSERIEQLKADIDRGIKIKSLLQAAEYQVAEEKLILPPGDNAFETYQRIQNLAPDGDERAVSGMQKIADHFLRQGQQQAAAGQDEANISVAKGLMVLPDYPPLVELKRQLAGEAAPGVADDPEVQISTQTETIEQSRDEGQTLSRADAGTNSKQGFIVRTPIVPAIDPDLVAETSASEQKRNLERQSAEKQRVVALAEQKNQEQNRLKKEQERLERERLEQENLRQIQEVERQAVEQKKQAEYEAGIAQRLSDAEQQLSVKPVTLASLEQAENKYHILAGFAGYDRRVSDMLRKLLSSHIALASNQRKTEKLSDAMKTVQRGLRLDAENEKLLSLQTDIASAIVASEKKQNTLPVIGTF